jgi:2,3-bisphosphoglycerate-dependent phosphoglycerate mutase
LFRHTQTYDNLKRVFSGRRNTRLTPEGIKQARKLAQKLKNKKIDLAFRPPLIRCQQTLDEVLKFHPGVEVIVEPLLVERDYGKLTGKSKIKLMKENFELAVKYRRAYDFPPPGGESFKEVKEKRIDPFCRRLVKMLRREKKNVAISATNNTMRLIRMFFENLSVIQMQTLENPFGDYASYVVK